jgi:hypothetical protein
MYRLLVGKPEEKRPLGRQRRRCVDYIRKDLGEIGSGGVDWIGLAQDRDWWRTLLNVVKNTDPHTNSLNAFTDHR